MIDSLLNGLLSVFSWNTLALLFVSVFFGTLTGVLPGIGVSGAVAILAPFILMSPDPTVAVMMIAGIIYGSQYGGSTASILINTPGESSSVATCLDGYAMACQGRANVALITAAMSSLFAGVFSAIVIGIFGNAIANISSKFTSFDFMAFAIVTLALSVSLSRSTFKKTIVGILFGALVGMIGLDPSTGVSRFVFADNLLTGVSFQAVAMGLFGLSEVFYSWRKKENQAMKITSGSVSKDEIKRASKATIRGSIVGFLFGMIPGIDMSSTGLFCYKIEKALSKTGEFGRGAIEGVAAPEAANNAFVQSALLPLMCFGVVTGPTMALIFAIMSINGIMPGSGFIAYRQEFFWTLIASIIVGNLFLVILNAPLIRIWASVLRTPSDILYPAIIALCCFGAFCSDFDGVNVIALAIFAMIGHLMKLHKYDPVSVIMGMIVFRQLEEHFRRSFVLTDGNLFEMFNRPLTAALILFSVTCLFFSITFKFNSKENSL